MKTNHIICFVLLSLCLTSGGLAAEKKTTEPGCFDESKFSALHKYIGTYRTEEFLNDPMVLPKLKERVGKDIKLLKKNLFVRGQIDLIGCNLAVYGNAPHKGFDEDAIVTFDLVSGAVAAGIKSELFHGKPNIYNDKKDYNELPFALKLWLQYKSGGYKTPDFNFR